MKSTYDVQAVMKTRTRRRTGRSSSIGLASRRERRWRRNIRWGGERHGGVGCVVSC